MLYIDDKTRTAPAAGRWREHGRGRLRQSRERWATWDTSSKHHIERLISPRNKPFYGSNLGLNLTSRIRRRHDQHVYTYTYFQQRKPKYFPPRPGMCCVAYVLCCGRADVVRLLLELSFSYNIARMLTDSSMVKYQGSRMSIDSFIGKYLGCRMYIPIASTFNAPVEWCWLLSPIYSKGENA